MIRQEGGETKQGLAGKVSIENIEDKEMKERTMKKIRIYYMNS